LQSVWGTTRKIKDFVANFIRFPAMQIFWKSVKIWQSYREFKSGNFFETQCSLILPRTDSELSCRIGRTVAFDRGASV